MLRTGRAVASLLVAAILGFGATARAAAGAADEPPGNKKEEAVDPSAKEPVAVAKPEPEGAADAPSEAANTSHGMQFGLRAGLVLGYKMDFRYDHSPFCHAYDTSKSTADQQKVCGFGAPPGLELAVSFAPLAGIEPYLFARFGFSSEKTTDTKALQLYGVGARLYTMSDSRLKIYIEPAIAIETEGGVGSAAFAANGPSYKTDLVFHVGAGPQYDFAKQVGVYLNAGLDVGVLRSINAILLANIGVQARFP